MFFSQSNGNKRKYRLTRWNIICRPKDQGGLDIEFIEIKNRCLLCKWLFKLLPENVMWHELITNKYLYFDSLLHLKVKPLDSHFWKRLMKLKDGFFDRGSFTIGNGDSAQFLEDT
jgi:hypothetical protein